MFYRWCGRLGLIVLACSALSTVGRGEEILFQENFLSGLSPRWNKVQFTGETEYVVQHEGTNAFLKATANRSASGLAVKLGSISPAQTKLRWRWQIDRVPPGGSDKQLKTFDHTARLFVAFKTFIGPPRTINYVWANEVPTGSTFEHPSSGRSRFIVLQSGNARAGQWITEERDIAADWKRLFGDDPPAIVGLGFMTDSDGTETTVTGFYDEIELIRGAGERK